MEKEIWRATHSVRQNEYSGHEFGIFLDRDFARGLLESSAHGWAREALTRVANEEVRKIMSCDNPYLFYKDTPFVERFSLSEGGLWLATAPETIERLLTGRENRRMIRYFPVGACNIKESLVITYLFSEWIHQVPVLKAALPD